jgi:hypothetical protein
LKAVLPAGVAKRIPSPSVPPGGITPSTTTRTFAISRVARTKSVHPDFSDVTLEFRPGDNVRCKIGRLRGPGESKARQRMIAVERIP